MTKTASKHDSVPGFEAIAYQGVSRRAFLLSTAGATVGIAFGSAIGVTRAFAQAAGVVPNAWMRVATDGSVTIMSPASEMGQGVMTAMPLLVAEEMDLDWSKVKIQQAPYLPKAYGNPLFGGGMTTGASRTTRGYYDIMRLAGLQAKLIMMGAAAQKWGVPASEVTTEPHVVVHKASGRRMGYGEIAAFAQVPAEPPKVSKEMLKPMRQQRLIGRDVPRIDVPDKVVGRAEFGIDVRMAGILYGTVMRAPVQGEKPDKIDDAEAKKVPGVVKIVPMPYGVGVVAETYPAARKARAVLKVEWTKAAKALGYNSGQMLAAYSVRGRNLADGGVEFLKHNDAKAAIAGAAKTVTAEYTSEHVAHACMEPMNATALVEGDKIEVWAPSQSGFVLNLALMLGLKYKPENIKTNITLLGGGFGRRVEADYVVDAAILARAVEGNPVKVIWTREDDIRNDKYRPLVAQHLMAGLDAQGNIVGFRHRIVAESIYARAAPPVFQQAGGKDQPVCEGSEINYAIPNHLVEYLREQRGVDVGFWRAVGPGYTKFAIETFIDEMAAAAGKDPIEYRASLWAKEPRARAVMEEVARMADWKRKRTGGRALGIAYSDAWGAHCAQVAEVSVERKTGKIRVHEVWCAIDPGVALQPRNIEAQIESAVIFGASHALLERITFSGGEVKQSNFHDYPIMRMNEAPRVTTKVMATDNPPSGMGEVGLPPVGAAIANAIAVITGKRLRSLPLDADLLKT